MNEGKKRCTGPCGELKPADTKHFYSHPATKDGLQSRCIPCTNADSIKSKSKRKRYYYGKYIL